MIRDKLMDEMQAEKIRLVKLLDTHPGVEGYKKALKNVNERIRYRQGKLQDNPSIAVPIPGIQKPVRVSMKSIVADEWAKGDKDPESIAKKHGFKKPSVVWYISKLRLK